MAEEWRREMYGQAKEAVESFVAGATGFTVDSEDPETFEARIVAGKIRAAALPGDPVSRCRRMPREPRQAVQLSW